MVTGSLKSRPVERIIISLPKEVLAQLDKLAADSGLSRSALVRMVLLQYLRQEARDNL